MTAEPGATRPAPPVRVAFWSRKGGTGKTSLAIACALALARFSAAPAPGSGRAPGGAPAAEPPPGRPVLLLDTDPQGTAASWGERFADRLGIAVRADSGAGLWDRADFASRFDTVLVDCAPTVTAETLGILGGVHRLLIPLRPAWPDLWALESVAELLEDLRGGAERPTVRVVLNQVGDEDLAPLRAAIADLGLATLPQSIPLDAAWPALFRGGSAPAAAAALAEAAVGPLGP